MNGIAVKVEGDPDGTWQYRKGRFHPLCANGQAGLQRIYDPWRPKAPLKRTNPQKGFGVDPKWVEISWDEAYNTVADKIKAVRAKGKDGVFSINQSGHNNVYGTAFSAAIVGQCVNLGMGMSWCEAGHYTTIPLSGGWIMSPDYSYCNLLLQTDSAAGTDATSVLVMVANYYAEAKRRGMKVVNFMPILNTAAAKASEWIPTAPGTHGAFLLGMLNVLLYETGIFDVDFIKNWTNGPYLIGPDGYYVRDQKSLKPLIWDPVDKASKTYDDKTVKDYALEGNFTVAGTQTTPAFQLTKQSLKDYTPEWAAKICGALAEDIRRIANEWGNTASIGTTITVDGVQYPYRPVAVDGFIGSGTGHQHGFGGFGLPTNLLCTIVGAQSVPGSWHPTYNDPLAVPFTTATRNTMVPVVRNEDGLVAPLIGVRPNEVVAFKYPPQDPALSEFFPIASMNTWVTSMRMWNPDKYSFGAPVQKAEVIFLRKANPMVMNYGTRDLETLYATLPFIVSVSDLIDESGQYADIILPEGTVYEGWLMAGGKGYVDNVLSGWLCQPVVTPLYGLPNTLEIYIEIADRVGALYGAGGLNDRLNGLISRPDQKLDLKTKYTPEQIVDRICRSNFGADKGLDWARQNGGMAKFNKILYQPYKKIGRRLPVYAEFQKKTGDELKQNMTKAGIDWDVSDYTAVPHWQPTQIHADTPPYDLVAVPYRKAGFSATSSMSIPVLLEVSATDPFNCYVWMNENTAKAKGLRDGDLVWVESVQDKAQGIVKLSQGIHPKAVGICINLGGWGSNEALKDFYDQHRGIPYMRLRPWGFDYCDKLIGNLENLIKVHVYKA